MANIDPPAISTPSRPRYSLNPKRSGNFTSATSSPNVAGFSPGGQVFEGYSYLSRSTSMSTSTRSRPKGLQSRTTSEFHITSPPTASRNLPSSPSSPHIPRVAASPTTSPFTNTTDLPQRRSTIHRMPSSISTPELHAISIAPTHPARSDSEAERLAEAVASLPHNPKIWLPSQVALYLTHVLGLVPRPVVEDVTAYVRTSRMGGRAFLRLSEKDLECQGLNLKWRKLMIEAVRKLRRDALRGRIWGNATGSMRWPKSAQDLEREEADEEDDMFEDEEATYDQDGIVRSSKTTSKLTLKRMRDSRKVRGMIQVFQTSPEKEDLSLSSPHHSTDAVYAPHGYVREQAQQILSEVEQKKLSLRRPLRPRKSTADFPWLESQPGDNKREDIEALLASLTEQEANDLANELGIVDLKDTDAVSCALQQDNADSKLELSQRREASTESADEVIMMPTLTRHGSADSTSVSECSGTESELDFTEDAVTEHRGHKPRYSVLDEDVIRAILAEEDHSVQSGFASQESSSKSELTRSHTTASILRPSRPYRASMYTNDELAALNDDEQHLHTRTKSSRELVEALMSSGPVGEHVVTEPDFATARLRTEENAPPIPTFEASSPSQPQPQQTAEKEEEYIFTLPDNSPSLKTGSIRRKTSRKATFGSKRGKAVLSLLNHSDTENSDLFASLPGATMLRQKSNEAKSAEDEEGWGGTLGRSSSRKSLNNVFDAPGSRFGSAKGKPGRFGTRRGLDRVASEAEGEAFAAKLEALELEREAEAPVEKYEETTLSEVEDEEGGLHRRPSVEQRLSSLFGEGAVELEDAHDAVAEEVVAVTADQVGDAAVEADATASTDTETVPQALETFETEAEAEDGEAAVEVGSSTVETSSAKEAVDVLKDATPVEAEETTIVAEAGSKEASRAEQEVVVKPPAELEVSTPSDLPVDPEDQGSATEDPTSSPELPTIAEPESHEERASATVVPATQSTEAESSDEASSDAVTHTGPIEEDYVQVAPVVSAPADEVALGPTPTITSPSADPVIVLHSADIHAGEDSSSKLLVPLTVIEPHPSGTGSIKKRSMVLVDRKRFESLARRMTDLEQQLEGRASSVASNSVSSSLGAAGGSGLRDMFAAPSGKEGEEKGEEVLSEEEGDAVLDAVLASSVPPKTVEVMEVMELEDSVERPKAASSKGGWWNPSSWASYLSSLNPYYSQPSSSSSPTTPTSTTSAAEDEDELNLWALLGRPESEQEAHLLSIGAIPAYMLGLGAGVGFVLVREVLGKGVLGRH
ncbi:hypothetical protein NDA16_004682 [Ustilago loliicola]|nr:hypothetical protein NDA16_004682 [Ustilago loliicola]